MATTHETLTIIFVPSVPVNSHVATSKQVNYLHKMFNRVLLWQQGIKPLQ